MSAILSGFPDGPVDWYDSSRLLVPHDYNPAKINELAVAAVSPFAVTFDVYIQPTTNDEAELISFAVPSGTAQTAVNAIIAALDAVCVNPARNELTEEQTEAAQLQNKIDNAVADIATLTNDTTWGAMSNAQKIEALRAIELHNTRSVRYLLRQEKKRQTGVFSLQK